MVALIKTPPKFATASAASSREEALIAAWVSLKGVTGFSRITSDTELRAASALVDQLLDIIGERKKHALVDLLDLVSSEIKRYEDIAHPMPDAEPKEVLRLLMQQHNLSQSDLADCASQSHISAYLGGTRAISKSVAAKLAARFRVNVSVFI